MSTIGEHVSDNPFAQNYESPILLGAGSAKDGGTGSNQGGWVDSDDDDDE